jgi:hypothetical protein
LKCYLQVNGQNCCQLAENCDNTILYPHIMTKISLSRIQTLNHLKIKNVDAPPPYENSHYGMGRRLFFTYLNSSNTSHLLFKYKPLGKIKEFFLQKNCFKKKIFSKFSKKKFSKNLLFKCSKIATPKTANTTT